MDVENLVGSNVVHEPLLTAAFSYSQVMLFGDVSLEHSRTTWSSFSATLLVGFRVRVPIPPTTTHKSAT